MRNINVNHFVGIARSEIFQWGRYENARSIRSRRFGNRVVSGEIKFDRSFGKKWSKRYVFIVIIGDSCVDRWTTAATASLWRSTTRKRTRKTRRRRKSLAAVEKGETRRAATERLKWIANVVVIEFLLLGPLRWRWRKEGVRRERGEIWLTSVGIIEIIMLILFWNLN